MKSWNSSIYRWLFRAAFLIYIIVLFDFVFFSAYFGRVNAEVLRYQDYNMIPLKTISNYFKVINRTPMQFITNIFGNIIAFMPFGILLPLIVKRIKAGVVILLTAVLSLFIELTQGYMGVGVMDIDDVILNVLGGILGYIVIVVIVAILQRKQLPSSDN